MATSAQLKRHILRILISITDGKLRSANHPELMMQYVPVPAGNSSTTRSCPIKIKPTLNSEQATPQTGFSVKFIYRTINTISYTITGLYQ